MCIGNMQRIQDILQHLPRSRLAPRSQPEYTFHGAQIQISRCPIKAAAYLSPMQLGPDLLMAFFTALPQELICLMADNLYSEPCILRRHIISKLLEQSIFQPQDDVFPQSDSDRQAQAIRDETIRQEALAMMDLPEKELWQRIQTFSSSRTQIDPRWDDAVRLAEKNWLTKGKPMNLYEFQDFCYDHATPGVPASFDIRSRSRTPEEQDQRLTLELFPHEHLIVPPSELSLSRNDRISLSRRRVFGLGPPPKPYTETDEQVCHGLIDLWTAEITHRLPESVKHVMLIAKDDFPQSNFKVRGLNDELHGLCRCLTEKGVEVNVLFGK